MKITLETPRLLLRPWRIEDAEEMFSTWANDPEVTKYLTWDVHGNVDVTKARVQYWIDQYEKPERLNLAITLKETGKLIGGIDVCGYLEDGTPVIGYASGKAYWNHGYMTEACKCLLDYIRKLGFKQVRIDACVDNIGSNRVIQKCGGVFQLCEEEERPLKGDTAMVNRYIVYL